MFAQVILPLAAVMALALLYFSVKLFFVAPDDKKLGVELPFENNAESTASSQTVGSSYEKSTAVELDMEDEETITPAVANVQKKLSGGAAETNKPSAQFAKKADITETKTAQEKERQKSKTNDTAAKTETKRPAADKSAEKKEPKTEIKAEAKGKEKAESHKIEKNEPQQARSAEKKASNKSRWDVQIGGFSTKEGAVETAVKAEKEKFPVYITESSLDGKPFYKVRVKGSSNKAESEVLAKKLADGGFPVYLIEIK